MATEKHLNHSFFIYHLFYFNQYLESTNHLGCSTMRKCWGADNCLKSDLTGLKLLKTNSRILYVLIHVWYETSPFRKRARSEIYLS